LQKKEEIVKSKTVLILSLCTALFALSTGCKGGQKNPNDSTPPTVEIKVKGADGQYAPASTASLAVSSTDEIDLMCTNSDPEGVSSIALDYTSQSDSCTVDSAIFSGSFSIDGVPPSAVQNLSGNPQVLTSVPLLAAVKAPLTCSVFGQNKKGFPLGSKVAVKCTGKNWSSNSQVSTAQKTLTINLH
jgi:hypothetical protein